MKLSSRLFSSKMSLFYLLFVANFILAFGNTDAKCETDDECGTHYRCIDNKCANLNIYDEPLKSCSYDGIAITGYTRTGFCNLHATDSGSHNVCLDISAVKKTPDNEMRNFCEITGQRDWCSESDRCHEGGLGCPRKNWCICEWAFASLIQAKGCDSFDASALQCESTSRATITAYQQAMARGDKKAEGALACLRSKCGDTAAFNLTNDALY